MNETTETPPAEAKKKPPAHEVLVALLRQRVQDLTEINRPWTDLAFNDPAEIRIEDLCHALATMEVPEKHRASVAQALSELFGGHDTITRRTRNALKQAANAIVPDSIR